MYRSFKSWYNRAGKVVKAISSFDVDSLKDHDWSVLFRAGLTPEQAAFIIVDLESHC